VWSKVEAKAETEPCTLYPRIIYSGVQNFYLLLYVSCRYIVLGEKNISEGILCAVIIKGKAASSYIRKKYLKNIILKSLLAYKANNIVYFIFLLF
jgi:hypothetical protein